MGPSSSALGGWEVVAAEARRRGVVPLDDDGQVADVAGARFAGGTQWADGALAGAQATPGAPTGERFKFAVGRDSTLLAGGEEDRAPPGSHTRPVTGAAEAALHRRALARLEEVLLVADCAGGAQQTRQRPSPPLVIVSHHAPHPACLPPSAVQGTWAAGNFATDLSHLTDVGHAALWIHGHLHVCTSPTTWCVPAEPASCAMPLDHASQIPLSGTT